MDRTCTVCGCNTNFLTYQPFITVTILIQPLLFPEFKIKPILLIVDTKNMHGFRFVSVNITMNDGIVTHCKTNFTT